MMGSIHQKKLGRDGFMGFKNDKRRLVLDTYFHNVKHYRDTWSTWVMLSTMYTLIYAKFVLWGHAIEMDAP